MPLHCCGDASDHTAHTSEFCIFLGICWFAVRTQLRCDRGFSDLISMKNVYVGVLRNKKTTRCNIYGLFEKDVLLELFNNASQLA